MFIDVVYSVYECLCVHEGALDVFPEEKVCARIPVCMYSSLNAAGAGSGAL